MTLMSSVQIRPPQTDDNINETCSVWRNGSASACSPEGFQFESGDREPVVVHKMLTRILLKILKTIEK